MIVGFVMGTLGVIVTGTLGVIVTGFATEWAADNRGLGPDHWSLWLVRGCYCAAVILAVVLVVFADHPRLRRSPKE